MLAIRTTSRPATALTQQLMLFGWGFWVWSVPMLAMLITLPGYDFGNAMGQRRRAPRGRDRR
jgi:hypothetical protein